MTTYKELLEKSFNENCRNSFSSTIFKAYLDATRESKEFGSFYQQAMPFLRWFYCEALLEKAAKKINLEHSIAYNKAKNYQHLIIKSNGLSLSAHYVDGNQALPRKAKYRASYASLNYDFFYNEKEDGNINLSNNHIYLLHDGKFQLETLCFTIPDASNSHILYTEHLDIIQHTTASEENISDDLRDKIKVNVESKLKQKIS